RLASAAVRAFAEFGTPDTALDVRYAPGAPEDVAAYRSRLSERRATDRRRGAATVGSHRDDLVVMLGGRLGRGSASQGQHRAIVLALKAAEVEVVTEARAVRPILLLDEVSSELDRARTAAQFAFLRAQRGQVLLTTTRPDLIDTGSDVKTSAEPI